MQNTIEGQRLAQKILSSQKMIPVSFSGYLRHLQDAAGADLSKLITLVDDTLAFMSGASHQTIRKSLSKQLSFPHLSANFATALRSISLKLVDEISHLAVADLINDIANPFFVALCENIFGVKIEQQKLFIESMDAAANLTEPLQSLKTLRKVQDGFVYLASCIENSIERPSKQLLFQSIYQEMREVNVLRSRASAVNVLATLLVAARTTSETLANILLAGSELSLECRSRIFNKVWLEKNTDKCIRFCASTEYLSRVATKDVVIDQLDIKLGEEVFIHVPSANRDATYYESCQLDESADIRNEKHVSFGAGVHRCPGEHLAQLSLQIFLPIIYQNFTKLDVDTKSVTYKNTRLAKRISSAQVKLY